MWHNQTPCCVIIIIIVYITLSPCSLPFPFRSTHLAAIKGISKSYLSFPSLTFSPIPNTSAAIQEGELEIVLGVYEELVKQKVSSSPVSSCLLLLLTLITYYIIYHFPLYFNALQIDQQRFKLKLAVLQVLLACCQQLDGQLLNDNKVYPLLLLLLLYFSVHSFSSPHSSCSRAGHAIRQRSLWPQTLGHTQERRPLRRIESPLVELRLMPAHRWTLRSTMPCCCCMPEGYEREEGRGGGAKKKKNEKEEGTRN